MKKFLNQRKGITLISLVVTIIILIILAGVSISLIMGQDGLIEKAKGTKEIQDKATAKEQLEMLKVPTQLNTYDVNLDNYLKELDKVKEKYEIKVVEKISNTQAEVVVGGKYKFLITDTQKGDVTVEYQGEEAELTLSKTSGNYTYPISGTFEVVKNISGGELSVKSENENIAKATINGNVITVEPGTTTGTTQIIVSAAAKGEYASQKAVYMATIENGTIELDAIAYIGEYDGQAHNSITNVQVIPEDAKIEYSLNGGEYSEEIPQVTEVSEYTISIRASKAGYTTKTISKTIIIIQSSYEVTYCVDTSKTYKESVKKGATCLSPTTFTPTKSGYTFVGWRENNTANSTVLTSKVMGDSAISLYAVFKKDVTVTYYNNSTTAKTATKQAYYNNGNAANPSFTLTQTSKSGWTTRGWSKSNAANGAISYASLNNTSISSSITLYGMYQKTVTANFYSGLSKANLQTSKGTSYYNSNGTVLGASIKIPSGIATSGWTWRGWGQWYVTTANATVTYANGSTVTIHPDNDGIIFYGLYQQTITLSYNGNGATGGSTASQTGTRYHNSAGNYSNPSFTLKANGFTKTNYTFSKWALGNASGTQYAAGASVTLSSNTTFFATWTVTAKTIYNNSTGWTVDRNSSNYMSTAYDLTSYKTMTVTLSYNPLSTWNANTAYYAVGVSSSAIVTTDYNNWSSSMNAYNNFHSFTYWDYVKSHDTGATNITITIDISACTGNKYICFLNTGGVHDSGCSHSPCHKKNSLMTITKIVLS